MPLGLRPRPFSHPDWLFEVKWGGFRSLARIDEGKCRLLSRNDNECFNAYRVAGAPPPVICASRR
jgi:ATP-dependent DNA ligase